MIFLNQILIDWFGVTPRDVNGACATYQAVRIMNATLFSQKKVLLVSCHFGSIVKMRKQRHMPFGALQESWHLNTNPETHALPCTVLSFGFYTEC